MTHYPVLVPSRGAVEAAATRLWEALTKPQQTGAVWDDEPAHVKNFYAQRALDMLTAAGPHLVADTCAHLAVNTARYDLDGEDVALPLAAAADRIRLTLDLADHQ